MTEEKGNDITAEALDYLSKRICNQGKVYIQLMYEVAMLSGIKSLLNQLNSMLATMPSSVGQSVTCITDKDLQDIDRLVGDTLGLIAQHMLKRDIEGTVSTDQLNDRAVKLATEIGGLGQSVAYKIANCVNSLAYRLDSYVATANELRQLMAIQAQAQQSPTAPVPQKRQLDNKPTPGATS